MDHSIKHKINIISYNKAITAHGEKNSIFLAGNESVISKIFHRGLRV